MKSGSSSGIVTAMLLAGLTTFASAEVKENPYQVIIERNPFGLRPIPPPVPPPSNEPVVEQPALEVKLTGITTLLGPPKVLLEVIDTKTKKTDRPRPLAVGDTDEPSGIKIVAVDPEAGTVRIKNGAAETTLDFDKDGIKPAVVAAAPGKPPVPGLNPAVPVPRPPTAGLPGATTTALPGGNSSGAIVAGNTMSAVPAVPNVAATPYTRGASPIPPRPLRGDAVSRAIVAGGGQPLQEPVAPPEQPAISRIDAEARIEAQRQILMERERAGTAPPNISRIVPPTRFSPPPAPDDAPTP